MSPNLPGLTAVADSLYGRAVLVGQIDSIGGVKPTIRGFKYNLSTGDTTTISETGSYSAGVYNLVTGSLLRNKTYYWRAYATNGFGTSYSPVGSFLTDTTAAVQVHVDGRIVNTIR